MAQTTNTGFNLTQATYAARLTIKYGSIALVVMIVGRIFLTAFVNYWKATHPEPPPPPTVGFGALPAINFPSQSDDDRPSSYRLETATGTTSNFGDRAKVYFSPKSAPSLLADESARQIAASYNFIFEPEVLNARTYLWLRSQPINYTLKVDIQTNHFELSSDYLAHPEILLNNELPDDFSAVERVKDFLSSADLLPRDMATASAGVSYLKALGGELSEAVSPSDADFIQVDLNRYPIDGVYEMFSPDGYKGAVSAIVSGAFNGVDNIVALDYAVQPIDYTLVHTYPIRTSQAAWQVLQTGEGYVADKGDADQAVVRSVKLGYYIDDKEQEYLQPIYIFEGDDGFIGYVMAVDPKYIQVDL